MRQATSPPAVAVIADAHVHDIHASYGGTPFALNGVPLTLRSWADTRASARAFNESAAALTAALTEVCARGIRHVVLLGDYSDDGQILSTQSLAARLHHWRQREGLSFYALPGNHDVFGPLGRHNTNRFVTAPGQSQLVTSDPNVAATEPGSRLSPQMYRKGQPAGLRPMAAFGLFRQPQYLHWESPFGLDDRAEARLFTASSPDGQIRHQLMEASYLVEPVPGLWLLMIDANVFEPRDGRHDPSRKKAFLDPSVAGWSALLRVKPFLIDWIADVCARAERLGKHLMAFSHYPAVDPFDDHIGAEAALFGQTAVARRTPTPAVAQALIRAGLQQHFSGHMHVHSVTRRQDAGRQLTNISVPSLVSFPPAFVIATPQGAKAAVETVSLAHLPLDPQLMGFYRSEAPPEAPEAGLHSDRYGDFLHAQLTARSYQRISRHWPAELARAVFTASAADLACLLLSPEGGTAGLGDPPLETRALCDSQAALHGLTSTDLTGTPLSLVVADWYALRQAGALLTPHIPELRLQILQFLATLASAPDPAQTDTQRGFFSLFLQVLATSLSRLAPLPDIAP